MKRLLILAALALLAACDGQTPAKAPASGADTVPSAVAPSGSAPAANTTPAAQESVGVNTAVQPAVQTHSQGESAWRAAEVQGTVRYLDEITTAEAAQLKIGFRDNSTFSVGANTHLTIDRFVYDPKPGVTGVGVSVVKGVFRFASNGGDQSQAPEQESFRTPSAAIGVRGTMFEAAVGTVAVELFGDWAGGLRLADDPQTATVIVLREGVIEVRTEERTVTLRIPGQAVAVVGKRVSDPFRLNPRAGKRLTDRLPPFDGDRPPPPIPPAYILPTPIPVPVNPASPPSLQGPRGAGGRPSAVLPGTTVPVQPRPQPSGPPLTGPVRSGPTVTTPQPQLPGRTLPGVTSQTVPQTPPTRPQGGPTRPATTTTAQPTATVPTTAPPKSQSPATAGPATTTTTQPAPTTTAPPKPKRPSLKGLLPSITITPNGPTVGTPSTGGRKPTTKQPTTKQQPPPPPTTAPPKP